MFRTSIRRIVGRAGPLPHVARHVVDAVAIRTEAADGRGMCVSILAGMDRPRPLEKVPVERAIAHVRPDAGVTGIVPPGARGTGPGTRGILPLRLRRQPVVASDTLGEPLRVRDCVIAADADHRMVITLHKARTTPGAPSAKFPRASLIDLTAIGHLTPGRVHERGILPARRLVTSDGEALNAGVVPNLAVVTSSFRRIAAHRKAARPDSNHLRRRSGLRRGLDLGGRLGSGRNSGLPAGGLREEQRVELAAELQRLSELILVETQTKLRALPGCGVMAPGGRQIEPRPRLGRVPGDPLALQVHHAKLRLRLQIPQLGCPPVPVGGARRVLPDPLALLIHPRQQILGGRMAVFGETAVPGCGLGIVLSHTAAARVPEREVVSSLHGALFGRLPEPAQGDRDVLADPNPAANIWANRYWARGSP